MLRQAICLCSVFVVLTAAGCGSPMMRVAEKFSIDLGWEDYERMVVSTSNGSISLVNDGAEQIEINGEMYARGHTLEEARDYLDQLKIISQPSESDASTFVVELEAPSALRGKNTGASFDIRIPASCAADLQTGNGAIRARCLQDHVLMKTSNGRIDAQEIEGEVEAASSNGRIHLVYVNGDVTAETSNGRVIADGVIGDCVLTTSNGAVTARDIKGAVRAETSNGAIRVEADPGADGIVYMRTGNGDITAELTPETRGELILSVSNGRIRTDLGAATLSRIHQTKRSIRAELNGGGDGRIEGRTSNGSIILNCR